MFWIVMFVFSWSHEFVNGSPAVGVVGGVINMNMTVTDRDINTGRNLKDQSNVILLEFFVGQANPSYVAPDVTYTGNISKGFVSFTMSNLRKESAGIYQYVISRGGAGNVIAGEQYLVIAESPSTPVITELSQQAIAGREYKLNCSAVSRSEKPGHNLTMFSEWKRNGVNIISDAKYGLSGTILTISSLMQTDNNDRFTCITFEDQRKKSAESNEFPLNVYCIRPIGVVGGVVSMNLIITDRDISTPRNLKDPNDVIILDFFVGQANPSYVAPDLTYTGNISKGFVSFTMSNVRKESAGIYQYVISKGGAGNVIAGEQYLVIAESPSTPVITELSHQAIAGREYKLNCSAVSTSERPGHNLTMFSEWKRNGMNIISDAKYGISGTILTISSLMQTDNNDRFTCIAFEDQRKKSAESNEFPLNVYYGPDNTQIIPSGELTVDEGKLLNLTCSGECNPPCSNYQWHKYSPLTLFGSSQTLTITNVSQNNAGVYSCTVNNTYIPKIGTAQITVGVNYGPDRIILSPSQISYELTENSSLSVNCSAYCVPSCQYRWTGPDGNYSDKTGILSISKITRNQTGVFTCTAFNPSITSKSVTATVSVTVQYGPDNSVLTPDNTVYTVDESNAAPDIQCSAHCFPSCTSRWYKEKKAVYGNPTDLLSLGNVYRNATGTYSCQTENTKTNATAEKAIKLVVQYPPTVDIESRNGSHNDMSLVIKCSAHGIPEQYNYRLTHKSLSSGIEIRQVSYEFISTGVIIHRFNNPTYMDTGIYTCSVNNGIMDYTDGSLDKSVYATVWIKGLPCITSRETSFYAEVEHSGRLIIELYNSLLAPMVTWYKHNGGTLEKLLNSDKYNIIVASSMVDVSFYSVQIREPGFIATLEIRNITEEDFNLYQVHVQNSVGEIDPLLLQLRVSGSKPQEKIDSVSDAVIIGSAIGSTLFVSLVVTIIAVLLYRKRRYHDEGNRVKEENNPRSLKPSTEKSECPQMKEKEEGQYLELQYIKSEDGLNLNDRSSKIVLYEKICSSPNNQEHVYNDLSNGERMVYENTKLS